MQIVQSLEIGGMERVVTHLCQNLDRNKYNPMVCCLKTKGTFAPHLESQGIKVFPLGKRGLDTPQFLLKLRNLLRKERISLVHLHNSGPFFSGTIAAKLAGVPVIIYTDHSRLFPDRKSTMITEKILSLFVQQVVAVSEVVKEDLIKFEGINREKILTIPNGAEESNSSSPLALGQKLRELKLDGAYPLIGSIARLVPQKGLEYLLEAGVKVKEEFPQAKFVIVGEGKLRPMLEKKATEIGFSSHVSFLGWRLDALEILPLFDIYVQPSLWEGLPMAILEAMAVGKPIVATKAGGIVEVLVDGENGLLVPPQNSQALAEGMITLLKNKFLSKQLGVAAQRSFRENFSVRRMVRNYEEVYERNLRAKGLIDRRM